MQKYEYIYSPLPNDHEKEYRCAQILNKWQTPMSIYDATQLLMLSHGDLLNKLKNELDDCQAMGGELMPYITKNYWHGAMNHIGDKYDIQIEEK